MKKNIKIIIALMLLVSFALVGCGIKKIDDPITLNKFKEYATKNNFEIGEDQKSDTSTGVAITYKNSENSENEASGIVLMYVNYSTEAAAISQYNELLNYFKEDESSSYSEEDLNDGKKLSGTLDSVYYFSTYRKSTLVAGYATTEEEKNIVEKFLNEIKY